MDPPKFGGISARHHHGDWDRPLSNETDNNQITIDEVTDAQTTTGEWIVDERIRAGVVRSAVDRGRRDRPIASAMAPGLVDIMPPTVLDPFSHCFVDGSHNPTRNANHQRPGRYLGSLDHDGSRTDHRAAADPRVIEYDRTHPDQAFVLNRTTVQDDPVAHDHSAADRAGNSRVGVDHRKILNVGLCADRNLVGVAAKDGVVPDACILAEVDVAEDNRPMGDKYCRIDHAQQFQQTDWLA
jgi:hypothetical protein